MMKLILPLAVLAAAPAFAQDQTQATHSAADEAVSQSTRPGVAAANATVDAQVQDRAAVQDVANLDRDAQYAADMALYREAVVAHRQAVRRDQRRYDRQQRAYADAMAAWRAQVAACKAGSNAACNAPSPDPANFY